MLKKLLILSLIALNSSFAVNINIDNPSIKLKISPDKVSRERIIFTNLGDKAVDVKVYLNDWVYNKEGLKTFFPAGSTKFSLKKMVTVFPNEFSLDAHKDKEVFITVAAPKDITEGKVGVVFFEALPKDSPYGSNAKLGGRVGSIIYYEPEGLQKIDASIEDYNYSFEKNKLKIDFLYNNKSNIHLWPVTNLMIVDQNNNTVFRKELDVRVMPNNVIKKQFVFNNLNLVPGNYQLILLSTIADYLDKEIFIEKNLYIK